MSTRRMTDLIYKCVERALSRRQPIRIGTVSSYDPMTHSAKLMRMPEQIETGFMPLPAHHVGNGWGILNGPQVGDQYAMGFANGDVEVPIIMTRLFSDKDKPPVVQSGEMLLQHQSTAKIFFDKNNVLHIVGPSGASQNITWGSDGSISIGDSGGATVVLNNGKITCMDKMHGVMILDSGVAYLGNTQNLPYYPVMTTGGNSTHVMATL